jgi:hypothetical protein
MYPVSAKYNSDKESSDYYSCNEYDEGHCQTPFYQAAGRSFIASPVSERRGPASRVVRSLSRFDREKHGLLPIARLRPRPWKWAIRGRREANFRVNLVSDQQLGKSRKEALEVVLLREMSSLHWVQVFTLQ